MGIKIYIIIYDTTSTLNGIISIILGIITSDKFLIFKLLIDLYKTNINDIQKLPITSL